MSADPVSKAWSWRKAVTRSGLMPTTRHVLLTLSLHMNEHGEGCYPPVEDLVAETGLSKRAVLEHLSKAIEAGWLVRQELGLRGRRWRRSEYQPAWPGRNVDVDMSEPEEGGDGRSPPHKNDVVTDDARGGDPDSAEVVTDDHHVVKESNQESTRSPVEREARARAEDPQPENDVEFQKLLKRYPGVHSPNLTFPIWRRLDDEGRRRALARLDAYLAERRKLKNDTVFSLQRYLHEKLFDQVDEPADGKPVSTTVKPRTDEWWALFWRRRKAGERVVVMLDQAKGDGSWGCDIQTLPDQAEIDALAEIETGSEQFRAWAAQLASEGLRLGGQACGKYIRVPSEWPQEDLKTARVG